MTADRWRRIGELFAGSMEQPEQGRDSFLAGACGGDRELHEELSALVGAAPSAAIHLYGIISSAVSSHATDATTARVGMRLEPYRVIEVLGAGGMGTVYLAERDDDQFRHKVAIKILHPWLAS